MNPGSDWIGKRVRERRERLANERLAMQHRENARSSYDAMVQHLRDTVGSYIQVNNQAFQGEDSCKAVFTQENNGGFCIVRGEMTLKVNKNEGTMITFETASTSDSMPVYGALEVAPDKSGNIRFKNKEDFLDLEQATELLLDKVLCR